MGCSSMRCGVIHLGTVAMEALGTPIACNTFEHYETHFVERLLLMPLHIVAVQVVEHARQPTRQIELRIPPRLELAQKRGFVAFPQPW